MGVPFCKSPARIIIGNLMGFLLSKETKRLPVPVGGPLRIRAFPALALLPAGVAP